jgi:hypothetical protein
MQLHADWAVTMGCGDVCPYVPTRVDDWDIADPAGRPLDEVREIRDLIADRVDELVGENIDAIRSDPTSDQWRLAKLLPALIEEFGERHPPEVIRGCADRILDDYDDVPIRSHVLTLAHKRTASASRRSGARCSRQRARSPTRRMLIVGGSDAGISAALRARELDPGADVRVVLADAYPNFSICGIPYLISREVSDWHALAHRTAADLETTGITLMLDTSVRRIDPACR